MRVLSVLIIMFLMVNSSSFAQTVHSEFIPTQEVTQLKVGDLLEATIRVWPVENADLAQFRKLEKSVLFNVFYMSQIQSLGVSQNNSDVVELKALFIVKAAKMLPVFSFKYNDTVIDLQAGTLSISELNDQTQEFYVLDQSLNKSKLWIIILTIMTILLIVGLIKRKSIKGYLLGLKPSTLKKSRKKYDDLFTKAENREDYESLYEDKDVWLGILTEKAPAHLDFLKTLNQYQYKKEWSRSDYEEVKSSFEIIRRSFKK